MPQAKRDVLEALANWRAGKPLRVIELGQAYRMKENPGMSPAIDMSAVIYRDQERAYAYCFRLVQYFAADIPSEHQTFLVQAAAIAKEFPALIPEEREAAESLAWKALLMGWRRALDGFKDAEYLEVQAPASDSLTGKFGV